MKRLYILVLCVLIAALCISSCSELGSYSINEKTVMTVGGVDVSYDMYKFCYNMALEGMGADFDPSNNDDIARLRDSALESIRLYCAQNILFDAYGIELKKEDKEKVDAEIQMYIDEQKGEAGYKKWLSENYSSGKFFREQIERIYFLDPYLRELLFTGIDELIKMDDETVLADVEASFYRYTQIFISCTEADYLTKRMEIDSAYQKLQNGEDFSDVASEYSDWAVNTERGAYSTKGEKLIEIEEAVLALEISDSLNEGTYSGVIETYEGFHIVKRLPLDMEYVSSHLDEFSYTSATRRYNELVVAKGDELKVVYKDYFFTLTHEILTKVEYA